MSRIISKTVYMVFAIVNGGALFVAILFAVRFPASVQATSNVLYVAPGGIDDHNTCVIITNPCATVQHAVDVASPSDDIRVAAGIYNDISTRARNDFEMTGIVTQVVYISKTLTIRGGYTITNWTQPYPVTQSTTLDAQGQGRVLYITGEVSPTLENLLITGGNSTGLAGGLFDQDAGGGMYIFNSTATVQHSQIFSNTSYRGAGMYLYASDSLLNNNIVMSNTAVYVGGGIQFRFGNPVLSHNVIIANTSGEWGGGLSLNNSDKAALVNNTISANTATYGGGLYLANSPVTLEGNNISANTASQFGGGMSLQFSAAILNGNNITGNIAGTYGGGLSLDNDSSARITNNSITSNTAYYGGGLFLYYSDALLINNFVFDNHANNGSGLYITDASPNLLHTTIAHNSGYSGIYVNDYPGVPGYSNVVMTNTILVSHTVGIVVENNNAIRLEGTLWGSGRWANTTDWDGTGSVNIGTINIWGDPDFLASENGNYHIGPASAAISAGFDTGVTTDIDGGIRPAPIGTNPDLGADEVDWKRTYLPLVIENTGSQVSLY